MIVSKIRFYSVPIDPDYTNVYDDYDTVQEYLDFLGEPLYTINERRTIEIDGLNGEIVIKPAYYPNNSKKNYTPEEADFAYIDFTKCNYIACDNATTDGTYSNDVVFFFITNVRTASDAKRGEQTCRLSLKYDSWSNTYKNDAKSTPSFIEKRHTKNAFSVDDTLYSNGRSLTTDVNSAYKIVSPVKKQFVIFRYLRISKNCVFKNNDQDDDIETLGLFPLEKDSIVIFVPWAIYDFDTKSFSTLIGVGNREAYDYLTKVNVFSPYVIESWYSALFPCKYDVTIAGVMNAYRVDFGINGDQNVNIVQVSVRAPEGTLTTEFISRAYTILSNTFNYDACIEINYNTKVPVSKQQLYVNDRIGDNLPFNFLKHEVGLFTYPNEYEVIKIADSYIKIQQPEEYDKVLKVQISYTSSLPIYNIFYDNEETVNFVLDIGFDAQTSTEAYQDFVAYRRNSFKADVINSLLPSALAIGGGIIAKRPEAIVGGVMNIIKSLNSASATMEDIYNNPYKYSGSTSRTNVYFYDLVDMPIIVKHEILGNDKLKLSKLIHYYGAEVEETGDVYENYRRVFDYVKTQNCFNSYIKNNQMRDDINEAFDRGVTKWHISAREKFPYALNELDRDIYNGQIGGY